MNKVLLNTLYVMSEEPSFVRLDNETVRVERDGESLLRVPLHHLGAIYVRGNTLISSALLRCCAERGIGVVWLSYGERFGGALRAPTSGNILLRLAQYDAYRDEAQRVAIARAVVMGKARNQRNTLLRRARDASGEAEDALRRGAEEIERLLVSLETAHEADRGALMGYEGMASRLYFSCFDAAISASRDTFNFAGRSKRPPRDPLNALLSFLYTLATRDCATALEGVGLDPQLGMLHEVRPGRSSLALDLVEEMRSPLVDRLVLALVNRRQIQPEDFEYRAGGACSMTDSGRRTVLAAYQRRKQREVPHELFQEAVPLGLVPHVQARILARHLRGDLFAYAPFEYR